MELREPRDTIRFAASSTTAAANRVPGKDLSQMNEETIQRPMGKKETITKIDAAQRQLETAIRLFFEEADSVSIHTLTAAAHGVLHDLKPRFEVQWSGAPWAGAGSIMKGLPLKPEYKKEWAAIMNKAQNFFKHADKDPDEVLELGPFETELLLFDACVMHVNLTGQRVPALMIYMYWFTVMYPEGLVGDDIWAEWALAARALADRLGRSPGDKSVFLAVLNDLQPEEQPPATSEGLKSS